MGGTKEGGEGVQGKEEKSVIQTNKKDVLVFYWFTESSTTYISIKVIYFSYSDIFLVILNFHIFKHYFFNKRIPLSRH